MAETNTQATAATEPVTGTGQESGTPGTAGTASGTQPSAFEYTGKAILPVP